MWFVAIMCVYFFFFNDTATTEIYTLSLHDALPISDRVVARRAADGVVATPPVDGVVAVAADDDVVLAVRRPPTGLRRSEEHTSELQSRSDIVCRLLLEKKKNIST